MKRIALVTVPALLAALSLAVHAFPLILQPGIGVQPWVPTPSQRIRIVMFDTMSGLQAGDPGRVTNVSATVLPYGQIGITATFEPTGTFSQDVVTFSVDVGPLPAGRYVASYRGSSVGFFVKPEGLSTAVEYFNAALGHYFVTDHADEIAKLDAGVIRGWQRTGESFPVLPADAIPSTGLPVCRLYGLPEAGLDSHFFSASGLECADVQQRWPTMWILETPAAFGAVVTDYSPPGGGLPTLGADNACPSTGQPLYRLYNNRPDANHRYTVSKQTRDAMVQLGWVAEGAYSTAVDGRFAMCVPLPGT